MGWQKFEQEEPLSKEKERELIEEEISALKDEIRWLERKLDEL